MECSYQRFPLFSTKSDDAKGVDDLFAAVALLLVLRALRAGIPFLFVFFCREKRTLRIFKGMALFFRQEKVDKTSNFDFLFVFCAIYPIKRTELNSSFDSTVYVT